MDTIIEPGPAVRSPPQQTGDPKFLDIALAHARTQQKFFLRPDGLDAATVFDFDPVTGRYRSARTPCSGYSPTSCWSRRPVLGHLRLHHDVPPHRREGLSHHARGGWPTSRCVR